MILLNPSSNPDKNKAVVIPLNGTPYYIYKGKAEYIPNFIGKELHPEILRSIEKQGLKIIDGKQPENYNERKGNTRFLTEEEIKKVKPEPKGARSPVPVKTVKYTETGLFALSKSEQIKLLNELGETEIPRLEKSRVKKILELQ